MNPIITGIAVKQKSDDKIIHFVECDTNEMVSVQRGMMINMNHSDYYTESIWSMTQEELDKIKSDPEYG